MDIFLDISVIINIVYCWTLTEIFNVFGKISKNTSMGPYETWGECHWTWLWRHCACELHWVGLLQQSWGWLVSCCCCPVTVFGTVKHSHTLAEGFICHHTRQLKDKTRLWYDKTCCSAISSHLFRFSGARVPWAQEAESDTIETSVFNMNHSTKSTPELMSGEQGDHGSSGQPPDMLSWCPGHPGHWLSWELLSVTLAHCLTPRSVTSQPASLIVAVIAHNNTRAQHCSAGTQGQLKTTDYDWPRDHTVNILVSWH